MDSPTSSFGSCASRATRCTSLAAWSTARLNVRVDGGLEPTTEGQLVSGNYFSVLGVSPRAGRAIGPDDDLAPNGHPVAMISYGYWKRRFGLDQSAIGRDIAISGTRFTIIGVTPPEFFGVEVGTAPDLFLPIMMQPAVMPDFENLLDNPIIYRTWLQVVGRLEPGVHAQQAAAALAARLSSGSTGSRKAEEDRRSRTRSWRSPRQQRGYLACVGSFRSRCSS